MMVIAINLTQICKFKTLDNTPLYYSCLSVSKDFTDNNMKEISLKGTACDFLINYGLTGTENLANIHDYSI